MQIHKMLLAGAMTIALFSCQEKKTELPLWLETDEKEAIQNRIKSDFSLTMDEAKKQLSEMYPMITDEVVESYIAHKYLEVKDIDGEKRMHRKSPSNLKLLCLELREEWSCRGCDALESELLIVDSIVGVSKGDGKCTNEYYVNYKFSVDVPRHDFLIGDTLKVWMPLPMESARQKNVKILNAIPQKYVVSTDVATVHNTIYFEIPVTENSDSILHFEYEGEYNVSAQYFSPQFINDNLKAYNKDSVLYKQYTAFENPHIIRLDSLAKEIVGDETNPYRQSELVYDYIVKSYPWAGAREYSTIECIPQYVLEEKHGDCGQVALLYISLMRTLGVPARWESGWMLHPGQKNLHDWAEVYFEGVGWVPVDASFGRYVKSQNVKTRDFYSTGMDQYRFATNIGVCGDLYPTKKYIRSETVDFQMGEVECAQGNLFYPGWKKSLKILKMHKVENQ